MKKLHFYHEPNAGNTCNVVAHKKAMPVYPKAIRFCITRHRDAYAYIEGVADFIKSTKIPKHCDDCPLSIIVCDLSINYGKNQCRRIWHKIWEYVK